MSTANFGTSPFNKDLSKMTRFAVLFSAVFLCVCLTTAGCGGSGEGAPSADEVSNFVAENPDLMERTRQSELVDLEDLGSSEIEEISND
jgi:hypothetical protein